mgnify:CR=1 FL=1
MVNSKKEISELINKNKDQIQKFGARSIGLFGSFISDQHTDKSDADIIVEFDQGKKNFDNFISLAYFLEDLFERKVELVTPESISKYLKPHILKNTEYVPFSVCAITTYK